MIVGNPIIMILKPILNWFRLRRNYIANAVDKIPPEIKDALVAWYSPVKQKLSNYDVIESYSENFTKFMNYAYRGKAVVTPNKIIITESRFNILNIVENFNNTTNDIIIKVTGVSEELKLFVQDLNSIKQYIAKDGIYKFTNNNYKYFGFGINKITTEANVVVEQLPTSILKDFSGNKHDAYLYGFKGKLNSGVGIYKVDFSKSQNINAFDNFERFNNKFVAKGLYNGNWSIFGQYTVNGIVKNKVTIKITGVSNLSYKLALQYGYITKDSKYIQKEIFINKDGIYSYDINDIEIPDENNIAQTIYNRFYFDKEVINDVNLIVEEIPDYPNQLCYDGKSYAVAYGLPILTDYTIIADRTWFDKNNQGVFMSKAVPGNDSAFIFEHIQNAIQSVWNYGLQNVMPIKDNGVVYCNKTSYNGDKINIGQAIDSDTLHIGKTRETSNIYFNGCHGNILLFNRTLTDDELDLVKEHFFGIVRIKDALMTTDKKYLALTNNNYIKLNK